MPNLKFLSSTVPEIWRGTKILKVGHVTHSRSVNEGSLVTAYMYLHYPTLIRLFTIRLSYAAMVTMRPKGSLQVSIAIVKAFLMQNFRKWPKI